jgi:rhodanese-related sulfurtransferase
MSAEHPLEIDCQSVKALQDAGADFLLIDCRTPAEWEIARLENAQLVPMTELPNRVGELESHRDKRIVVHCHHGGRSLRVVHWLRQQGFPHAQNMTGGIDSWAETVDPSVPRY